MGRYKVPGEEGALTDLLREVGMTVKCKENIIFICAIYTQKLATLQIIYR